MRTRSVGELQTTDSADVPYAGRCPAIRVARPRSSPPHTHGSPNLSGASFPQNLVRALHIGSIAVPDYAGTKAVAFTIRRRVFEGAKASNRVVANIAIEENTSDVSA